MSETRSNRKILGNGPAAGISAFGAIEENKKFGIGVSTPREMVRLVEMLEQGKLVSALPSGLAQLQGTLQIWACRARKSVSCNAC